MSKISFEKEIRYAVCSVGVFFLSSLYCWSRVVVESYHLGKVVFIPELGGGVCFSILMVICFKETVKRCEKHVQAVGEKTAQEIREQQLDHILKTNEYSVQPDDLEIVRLKARVESLDLELAEYRTRKNPWKDWFLPICATYQYIIAKLLESSDFKITKPKFDERVLAFHPDADKVFGSACAVAWKNVPERLKITDGRPLKKENVS